MKKSFIAGNLFLFLILIAGVLSSWGQRGRVLMHEGTLVTDRGTKIRGVPVWMVPTLGPEKQGSLKLVQADGYREFFRSLSRDYGMNAIRLSYTAWYAFHHPDFSEDEITPQKYVAAIDSFVKFAREDSIYVIINYHDVGHFDLDHMVEFWDFIAPRYKDDTHVIYELMNEPVKWFPKSYGNEAVEMVDSLFRLTRRHAPQTHLILWSFANLGNKDKLLEKITETENVSYDNASIGFHFGYGGGGKEEFTALKDAGYSSICTEFYSKDESTKEPHWEKMSANVKSLEDMGTSWVLWSPTASMLDEKLRMQPQYRTTLDEKNICWIPDFGNWPTGCEPDTTGTDLNLAPVVSISNSGPDTISVGDTITLTGTATDDGKPEGSQLQYEWRKLLGPTGVTQFLEPNAVETKVVLKATGDFTLSLDVSDGDRASSAIIDIYVRQTTSIRLREKGEGSSKIPDGTKPVFQGHEANGKEF